MKYTITKFYIGNIEMNLFKRTITLTNFEPQCIVDENEYEEILSKYESLILNGLIVTQRIKPETKEDKKFNKK